MQLVKKRPRLFLWQVLEAPLEYATAVRVRRELVDAPTERSHEGEAFGDDVFDDLLNDLRSKR